MREIKFSILLQHEETGYIVDKRYIYDEIYTWIAKLLLDELRRYSVISQRQYTWLNDKNQKEIYEGDILRWDNPSEDSSEIYIVRWNLNRYEITHESRGYIHALDKTHEFEIIWNIYENPELTINQPANES